MLTKIRIGSVIAEKICFYNFLLDSNPMKIDSIYCEDYTIGIASAMHVEKFQVLRILN